MPTPIQTAARHAVWDALDAWPALAGAFRRTYRFEDLPGRIAGAPTPSIGDLPALAIVPVSLASPWVLNEFQEARCELRFDLWTREWDVRLAELLWEEMIRALHHGIDNAANAKRIVSISEMTSRLVALGDAHDGPTATRWSFTVTLSAGFWNPRV